MTPKIISSVKFLNQFPTKLLKIWRVLFLIIGFGNLAIWGISHGLEVIINPNSAYYLPILNKIDLTKLLNFEDLFLGLAYIFIPLGFSLAFFEIFIALYLKEPKLKGDSEPLEYLDFDTAQVFYKAALMSAEKNLSISTNALFAALVGHSAARALWQRLEIYPPTLEKQVLEAFGFSQTSTLLKSSDVNWQLDEQAQKCIEICQKLREEHKSERILVTDLLIALFDTNEVLRKMFLEMNIDRDDLVDLGLWFEANLGYLKKHRRFWELENLLRSSPIGVDWVYGYTPLLDRFATDVSKYFETGKKEVRLISRQEIINQIEITLSRSGDNNVLLVGEPGIGKHTIVYGFTDLVAKGKALPALKYKRVLELNMALLTSSSPTTQEMEATLIRVLKDAEHAGNIILIIDDIHNFVGAAQGVGKIDISEVLKPYLGSSRFQVIALTDSQNFHKYIEPRVDLMRLFEKIDIQEPNKVQTTQILQTVLPAIERQQGVFVTHQALKNIVDKADFFIPNVPFPEKAIDLLTEVASSVAKQGKSFVLAEDVNKTITQKTHVPLGEVSGSEKEKIDNLEKLMHEDIVNQELAVKRVAETMLRLRVGLMKRDKPAGVFLFVGPTGVGKTLTAKILAKVYFGSEDKMIRFDMSEFQESESMDRFIGSLRTQEPGQFVNKLRESPFSVVLLDEFEKAHPNILNLFLPVFDEARMTDAFGKTVSLKQNIIIATSNAGSEFIRQLVTQNTDTAQEKELILDYILKNHLFTPELLNRFDEIIVFHPLTREQIKEVAKILLKKLSERLKEQSYLFAPNEKLIDYISEIGFDPQFGARPMQRVIQNTVEVIIARKILDKQIQRGEEFTISVEELPK
ncbi:MAG: ATP-dependent Clp protease ATP-binding subunit [Parcubacteria group bacterium]|nr:ATP-dependent Clp protease ATP-binding subunit [Parcubacteria group bacterium]